MLELINKYVLQDWVLKVFNTRYGPNGVVAVLLPEQSYVETIHDMHI